MIRSVVRL